MLDLIWSLRIYYSTPIVLSGYILACLGAGLVLLRLLNGSNAKIAGVSSGTILVTGFILGEGVLAGIWLLLGLRGWLSSIIVAVICFVFVVGGLYFGRATFAAFMRQFAAAWRELREDTWGWQMIAGLTIILCLTWVTSLGRPLATDATAFYFAFGKYIASSQRLTLLPGYEQFSSVGLVGELHFAALRLLHSPDAAKLFSWPTIIATGVVLAALGRLTGMSRRGQWLTLSILFSSSAVVWLSGDGKVDLFAAAFGVAAYYWAMQIRRQCSMPVFFLTGIFSGYAIVAKLSNTVVLVPGIVLLVFWGLAEERKSNRDLGAYLRVFGIGSTWILLGLFAALVPHFIKNTLLFYNPFEPIGSSFGAFLHQTWFGTDVTRRILLTYPLALTYGSYWGQSGNISPLLLAFLPLALYLPRARPFLSSPLVIITLAGLVGLTAWVLYSPSMLAPRYILATLLLFALLPARAAECVSLNEQKPRLLASSISGFTMVFLVIFGMYFLGQVFFPEVSARYFLRTIDECDRDGLYCQAMKTINRDAEPGDRVFLASYQRYWLRGDLLQCIPNQDDLWPSAANADENWFGLYRGGFKYLFLDWLTHTSVIEALSLDRVPAWVELTLLFEKDYLKVYRLQYHDPPASLKPAFCQKSSSGPAWDVLLP